MCNFIVVFPTESSNSNASTVRAEQAADMLKESYKFHDISTLCKSVLLICVPLDLVLTVYGVVYFEDHENIFSCIC